MYDDNNNERYRENNSLNYNEVLAREVVEVESNYKMIFNGKNKHKKLMTMVGKNLVV